MGNHLVHVFFARAEHDVLAAFIGDVAGKYFIKAVRLLQGALQGVQIFLVHVLDAGAAQIVNSRLIPRQVLLVFKNRGYIFRGRQNTPDDCLAQGHFRCDMTIE